jgi:hypothetical protein
VPARCPAFSALEDRIPKPPASADIHGAASASLFNLPALIGESDLSVAAVVPSPIKADTLDSFNLISCFDEVRAEDLVSVQQFGYKHPQIRSLFTFGARQTSPRLWAFGSRRFDRGLVVSIHGGPHLLWPAAFDDDHIAVAHITCLDFDAHLSRAWIGAFQLRYSKTGSSRGHLGGFHGCYCDCGCHKSSYLIRPALTAVITPETQMRSHWTKVSINTFVSRGTDLQFPIVHPHDTFIEKIETQINISDLHA